MKAIVVAVLFYLVSCGAQKNVQQSNVKSTEVGTLVAQNNYSGVSTYQTMVIRDYKSLSKFYSEINKTRKPGLQVPSLDFTKEMAVILCMGHQKGKKTVKLMQIEESEEELTLTVDLLDTPGNNAENQVISYPFYIYKLPFTPKRVILQNNLE